jgi:hypothetical protein
MSITEIIAPIQLLKGTHENTAQTGQGCFMNVIAYLNGEPQITDQSPCVCVTVRPLAIKLNDAATDEQRKELIPFIERAMGSATKDRKVLEARTARMRQYGAECQEIINAWRVKMKAAKAYAYAHANANAYAHANANAYANAYANAKRLAAELKADIFNAGLRYLDDVLPRVDAVAPEVMKRGASLVRAYTDAVSA